MNQHHFTIELAWPTKESLESNLHWMMLHFRFRPVIQIQGNKVKFSTSQGQKYRLLKRLAAQCGAQVLEKTIDGINTNIIKFSVRN